MDNQNLEQKKKERDSLYRISWILIAVVTVIFVLTRLTNLSLQSLLLPCYIHEWIGIYCPGCGGSRSLLYFFQGKIGESLYYHPIVPYGIILFFWFLLSNSIERLSKGRLKIGMYYRNLWVHIAVFIIVLNFVVKNAVLLLFGYPMIP